MALAQAVDRRVGDLREILPEEMVQTAIFLGQHRQRRVVAHRADRFLGILDHRCKDHFHILQRMAGGGLAADQFLAGKAHAGCGRSGRQIVYGQETLDQIGIGFLGGDPVLERAVLEQLAGVEVDRDHLARAEAALLDDLAFRDHDQSGFRADDQQIVGGDRIAQRAQRVAIDSGDRPVTIGHRQCCRTVPRLHDARHIFVHRLMRRIDIEIVLPSLGDQHDLGGRGVAAGAADGLEHRIQCGGVGGARRDHRLDILAVIAEGEARHLDLVALHPVLVAANGVDLAIVSETAERLRQPPLREGIGRIALVEDRHPAFEPVV